MAVLNIRNLPDAVHRELRKRAAGHGRSIEAEARAPRRSIAEIQKAIDEICGGRKPRNVVEELIRERREGAAREEAEFMAWSSTHPR
jgi:hypothetical protein